MGNANAQRNLGIFYINGEYGLSKSPLAGRLYMESAAINGNSEAQIDFGLMNIQGLNGLAKNRDVGMEWLKKAAKQKNMRALQEMRNLL